MSSSLDHKCQRCGSQYHGQVCPFCTITGLDVNALLAAEGLTMPQVEATPQGATDGRATLLDVVSNRVYPVGAPVCRYGRDISNDIVLTGDKSLSRFHFQLTINNNEYFVEDAGSRNGTFLNGSPVTAPRKVVNGDIISAGMSRYRLVLAGEEGPEAEPGSNGNAHEPEAVAAAAPPEPAPANYAPTEEAPKPVITRVSPEPEPEPQPEPAPAAEKEEEPAPAAQAEPAPEPAPAPVSAPKEHEPKQPQLVPQGNKPESDLESSKLLDLLPANEDELGDTASRFLKLAGNPQDRLWPDDEPQRESKPGKNKGKSNDKTEWPEWCTTFTFAELDQLRGKVSDLETEIAAKQSELEQLTGTLGDAEGLKNRLLATRDNDMVEACSSVFRGLGWETQLNPGTMNELVLSAGGKAVALAKIVSTESQPKPNELANLVSSLSNYWSEHGVEPKGIMLVAFISEGPLNNRPELSPDLAEYAAKKNVCLMNSLQLLSIYRDAALRNGSVEIIKADIVGASGLLSGFDL